MIQAPTPARTESNQTVMEAWLAGCARKGPFDSTLIGFVAAEWLNN
jgi:hypothetical protein